MSVDTIEYWLDDAALECESHPDIYRARRDGYAAHRMAELSVIDGVPQGVTSFERRLQGDDQQRDRRTERDHRLRTRVRHVPAPCSGGPIPAWTPPPMFEAAFKSIARASPRSTAPYTDGIDRLAGTPVEDEGGLIEEPGTPVELPAVQVSSPSQRMRLQEGFVRTDMQLNILREGLAREVDTTATVTIASDSTPRHGRSIESNTGRFRGASATSAGAQDVTMIGRTGTCGGCGGLSAPRCATEANNGHVRVSARHDSKAKSASVDEPRTGGRPTRPHHRE